MTIINDAKEYAYQVHSKQTRKGKPDVPFTSHLDAVAEIASKLTNDENIIAAAWLHDTVEDTSTTIDGIRLTFCNTIADYVDAETENKFSHKDERGTWKARKLGQLDHLQREANINPDVLIIALADKLANTTEMVNDYREVGDDLWNRFNSSRDDQKWYYNQFANVVSENDMIKNSDEYQRLLDNIKILF